MTFYSYAHINVDVNPHKLDAIEQGRTKVVFEDINAFVLMAIIIYVITIFIFIFERQWHAKKPKLTINQSKLRYRKTFLWSILFSVSHFFVIVIQPKHIRNEPLFTIGFTSNSSLFGYVYDGNDVFSCLHYVPNFKQFSSITPRPFHEHTAFDLAYRLMEYPCKI